MTNQYTAPAISGYNTSPPSDDGAATEANEVVWDTHKTKLGDPLKTFAEAISTAVSSAFDDNMWNAINTQSTTYIVQLTDRGALVVCSGTFTVTLPAAATAGAGFAVGIKNGSTGVITIDGDSSETVNGAATITLDGAGEGVILVSDGSNWETVNALPPLLADINGITYAQGDVIYYDGTNLINLGPGTAGKQLQTGGAAANPSWEWPGHHLLETQTVIDADNATSVDFTTGIDSTFSQYELHIENLNPETDDQQVWLRFQIAAAFKSGAADYAYEMDLGSRGTESSEGAAQILLTDTSSTLGLGNASNECMNGVITLFDPASTVFFTRVFVNLGYDAAAGAQAMMVTGSGRFDGGASPSNGAVTGLQLLPESTTIKSGVFRLYGVRK